MKKVVIHHETRLLDDLFQVHEAYVSFQRYSGEMGPRVRRLCFERGDSVGAIVFNRDSGRVVLIEQFRYAAHRRGPGWITEIVAGMLSPEETPDAALRREVREEIGYEIDRLHFIASFFLSPGGSSERLILYCAEVTDLGRIAAGGGVAGEGEDIRIVEYSVDALRDELASARIHDAKTLIAVMWLLSEGRGTLTRR